MFPSDLERVVLRFYEDLNTPLSLGLALRVKYKEWEGVSQMYVDPSSYNNAHSYALDAAAVGFLKKFQELPIKVDRVQQAKQKWLEGERSCLFTNRRLIPYLPEFLACQDSEVAIQSFFGLVRKKVRRMLGPCPETFDGSFGPGATRSDDAKHCAVPHKFSSRPTLTPSAYFWLPQLMATKWGSAIVARGESFKTVSGNRFETAPKTSLTDRPIGVEPAVNVYFQKGVGAVIKKRLHSYGLDMLKAQAVHKQLACESSVSRRLCTVDLSNASDTLCKNLVRILLPRRWFLTLDSLRSQTTEIDGKRVLLEKFSSMGNGFTFELETLIFLAISETVMEMKGHKPLIGHNVSVFGDDILVPDECYELLRSTLAFCGFEVNQKKSFSGDTPFRESCGGDYFLGTAVRPFSMKKKAPRSPAEWITLANGIHALYEGLTPLTRHGWFAALDQVPSHIRSVRGPKSLGDLVIHDRDTSRWQIKTRSQVKYIRVFRPCEFDFVSLARFDPTIVLASITYGVSNASNVKHNGSPRVILRGDPLAYKIGWSPFFGIQEWDPH